MEGTLGPTFNSGPEMKLPILFAHVKFFWQKNPNARTPPGIAKFQGARNLATDRASWKRACPTETGTTGQHCAWPIQWPHTSHAPQRQVPRAEMAHRHHTRRQRSDSRSVKPRAADVFHRVSANRPYPLRMLLRGLSQNRVTPPPWTPSGLSPHHRARPARHRYRPAAPALPSGLATYRCRYHIFWPCAPPRIG